VKPGSSFPVIGDVLTLRDIVATFQQVLDRNERYQEVPDKAWADAALCRGYNQHAVEHLSKLWQALRTGSSTYEVPDTILKLAGKSPKTFEEFLQEQKDAFKPQFASAIA
jgi:hypothetical protein